MQSFMQFLTVAVICVTVLGLAFMVALSLPKSKLRCIVIQVCGWLAAIFCGVYIVSPLDAVPDVIPVVGWVDDIGALVAGLASAKAALDAGRERKRLEDSEEM